MAEMKVELLTQYACQGCGARYADSYSARDCCEPEEFLVCSVCDESFDADVHEDEAKEHLIEHSQPEPDDLWKEVYGRQLLVHGMPPLDAQRVADKALIEREREIELAKAAAKCKLRARI
jgi:hypothetical protein